MPTPRRPFRLNVGFIVHEEVGYSHEFPFDFDKVQLADDLTLNQFEGLATIGRTPQGLILQAKFSAQTTLECVRCLNPFDHTLHWEMTELYAFNKKSVSESGLLLPEDAHIDLQPLIREYALLETPISPICKPGCKGLCPVCGEDLNQVDCGHQAATRESPFSTLKDLLGE
ncbi:MAG: YceD family protein [Chloroflexota bacterium]